MSDERERDPSVEAPGGPRPETGDAEDDDTVAKVKSATWTTSTFKSSRVFTEIPDTSSAGPKTGTRKHSDQLGKPKPS
jgi:hypothetical protein